MPASHPPLLKDVIKVLEMNEAYEEIDGSFRFTTTLVVYKTGGNLYHAVSEARYSSPSEVKVDHLSNHVLIPVSAYSPLFPSGFTRAPDPPPRNCHIKKSRLISYDRDRQGSQPNLIAESVLLETAVCEFLKPHPHPNIAKYLGCQVSDGRITGLCFVGYNRTLMQEVNPSSLSKREFTSKWQKSKDYSRVLAGIKSGIQHLHGLGLVHNDINPSNSGNERGVKSEFQKQLRTLLSRRMKRGPTAQGPSPPSRCNRQPTANLRHTMRNDSCPACYSRYNDLGTDRSVTSPESPCVCCRHQSRDIGSLWFNRLLDLLACTSELH